MENPGLYITDAISMTFWLFMIVLYAFFKYQKNREQNHYKYYFPHLIYKLGMGMVFALVYLLYYKGGDTTAYWDGGVKLNNLFFKNPISYLNQLFGPLSWENYWNYYDGNTGYPPSWIYKEKEGFFVCKIVSVFAFFTAKSYLAITLLFSFFISEASWKLFELFRQQKITSDRNAAIAALFIPSVNFWCTGIMKDTIVLFSLLYILYLLNEMIQPARRKKILLFLGVLFWGYMIYKIRSYVLISLMAPLLLVVSNRAVKLTNNLIIRYIVLRFGTYALGIIIFLAYFNNVISFGSLSSEKLINTAIVTQKDFANNVTYGDKRYDIGLTGDSYLSLALVSPQAIAAGLYRPYIWEAQSIFMLLSGFESLILILLSLRFILSRSILKKLKLVRKNEFVLFISILVLIFAYFVGFTSGLFGTLVRFKTPLLPFFVFILVMRVQKPSEEIQK